MGESRLRSEKQTKRRSVQRTLDPVQKMLDAYALSMEARKLFIAGLRDQGFSETEILQILKAKRK
jgi:hypothetical protein